MKILLSAFACAPSVGSEQGVGWRWAVELAKHHDVLVVTDVSRQAAIEEETAARPVQNLRFEYFRPGVLRRVPLNSTTAQLLYAVWQFFLLGFARRLQAVYGFQLAIHITYGVFRHPSFLGFLGVPFVFGPVGGGEDAPWRLKRSIRGVEKFKEILRTLLNVAAKLDPFLWLAYSRAELILVKTRETAASLPKPFRSRAIVFSEIGVDVPEDSGVRETRQANGAFRILYAGRLLGWKGVHFALQAVAQLCRKGYRVEFTIVGRGPYEPALRELARELDLKKEVQWLSHVPQLALFKLYREMDCLLFPSLHDSSGNVVLEALSFGLPVVCLDLGGPATLVDPSSAIVVRTQGLDEAGLSSALTQALASLIDSPERLAALSTGALRRARKMSWSGRIEQAMLLVNDQLA